MKRREFTDAGTFEKGGGFYPATENEYTYDRIPITDDTLYPDTGVETASDYTEESTEQLGDDVLHLLDGEEGIISESELLREGVVYDNELAEENMENDFGAADN